MSVGRFSVILLSLVLAAPAVSQSTPDQTNPDIVINGVNGAVAKKGDWKRAESDHVVVFSRGSDDELKRVSKNIERLYRLMSRIYRRGDLTDPTVKPQVMLVDTGKDFRAMQLANLRSSEGPYINAFTEQAYYDPREDGPIIAVSRSSQIVELNTNRAYNLDCDDQLAAGAIDGCKSGYQAPAVQTWEQRLYAAYARHFILTYVPAAYPRWYLDGVGVLFSTMTVRADGAINYATPPENYIQVFRAYGDIDVASVLTGKYLATAPGKEGWTPYHAWLLTHYFVMSPLKPDRAKQFQAYMTAIHQGQSMADAAKVFGNLGTLQRELISYRDRDKAFARTAPGAATVADPIITTLSPTASALVGLRVQLGSRLASGDADAVLRRDGWVSQLRDAIGKLPYDAEAQLLLAEAECRAGRPAECQADAERVLAKTPDNVRALTWRGIALTDRALGGDAVDRTARLILARAAIDKALALDGDAPLPLIARFQSYARAGEAVPDVAIAGMAKVIRELPAAPGPRLWLAAEMLRQGKADVARRLVDMVIYGGYDSPEKAEATRLFK